MSAKISIDFGDMALALALWMCTLPLVTLLVAPFFGLKMVVIVAVALFFVVMVMCWGACGWKVYQSCTKSYDKPGKP